MWILSTVIRNSPICSQGQFPELTLCPLPDPFTEELNTTRVLRAENERENQYRSRSCPNACRQPKLQSELSVNLSPCWWFICICTGEDTQCQLTHISSWHNDRKRRSILARQQWNSCEKKKKSTSQRGASSPFILKCLEQEHASCFDIVRFTVIHTNSKRINPFMA